MLFKLSNLNSNLALTLGYLKPALNNSALFGKSRSFASKAPSLTLCQHGNACNAVQRQGKAQSTIILSNTRIIRHSNVNSSFLDSRYQLFEGRLALTRGQVFFQILVRLLFKRIFSEVFSAFLAELPMIKLQTKRIKLNIICKLPFLNYNFAH